MSQPVDNFHAHLDVCRRCEEKPWDLCPIGARLLMQAATEITNEFKHLMLPSQSAQEEG